MQNELVSLKNKHRSETCVIFGNGKSLRKFPWRVDVPTFGTNRINLIGYTPTYYCVSDIWVVRENYFEISNIQARICFAPDQFRKTFAKSDNFWMFVNWQFDHTEQLPQFSKDIAQVVYGGGTVLYMCLQIAYYMGFSTVYLYGVDFDYIIPATDTRNETIPNVLQSNGPDPNHFDDSYFGAGRHYHDPNLPRMRRAFLAAKRAFHAAGRNIFDATIGGKLDVFPKKEFPW